MSVKDQESQFIQLWSKLRADEQYAGLSEYMEAKMNTLQSGFSDLRDEISDCLSEEQCDRFDALITSVCHPPPGCSVTL